MPTFAINIYFTAKLASSEPLSKQTNNRHTDNGIPVVGCIFT